MKIFNGVSCVGLVGKECEEEIRCVDIFKQIILNTKLCIPDQKPDAENILEIIIECKILKSKFIHTALDKKVIIHGLLDIKVVYTSLTPEQSVHSTTFQEHFYTFISMDKECHIEDSCKQCSEYKIKCYVEDIEPVLIDNRTISLTSIVLITLKKCILKHHK